MKTEIIVAGSGRNYVFMSARGPWGEHAEEMSTHRAELSATVMTAHFPVQMFFSAPREASASPTSLRYLPAWPFMDNTGGLSVVLLRDEFSAEISAKERKKNSTVGSTQRAPPWQLVCVVKNTAGAWAHLKMHLMLNMGLMHKYIHQPPALKGTAAFGIIALF